MLEPSQQATTSATPATQISNCRTHLTLQQKQIPATSQRVALSRSGIRIRQLSQLSQLIEHMRPDMLCERWLEQCSSLDPLLWTLFNAAASFMSQGVPSRLRNHISHIVGSTCLSTHERHLEMCLRRMPYTV
jgi:hypothetical protein